jgi:hypothetical protein
MIATAQGTAAGLPPCETPDLREIPLGDLARLADSGDSMIQDSAATLAGDSALTPVTRFSSAI